MKLPCSILEKSNRKCKDPNVGSGLERSAAARESAGQWDHFFARFLNPPLMGQKQNKRKRLNSFCRPTGRIPSEHKSLPAV